MGDLLTALASCRSRLLWRTYAAVYDRIWDAPLATQVVDRILAALGEPDGGVVLDVGAGTGLLSGPMTRAGWRVLSLDAQPAMLLAGRRAGRVTTGLVADATLLPVATDSVGHVVCGNLLHLVDDPEAVLAEIGRVLTPGGIAVLVLPDERVSLMTTVQDDLATGRPLPETLIAAILRWLVGLASMASPVRSRPEKAAMAVDTAVVCARWQRVAHHQIAAGQHLTVLRHVSRGSLAKTATCA